MGSAQRRDRTREYPDSNGIFHVGRPSWLTDKWLQAVQDEADANRADATWEQGNSSAEAGQAGLNLATSAELSELVATKAMAAAPSGAAAYLYYDRPGAQMRPHVDNSKFVLNVLMNLRHQYSTERRSAFLLFPHGPAPIRVSLDPGMLILFHAGAVVHARSRVSANGDERICNIGIGFAPLEPLDDPGYWRPEGSADERG